MVRAKFPIVRIGRPDVRTLSCSGPLRPLFGRVLALVERVCFTESAWDLATGGPDTRGLPHLCSPFHACRPKPPGRKIQQRVTLLPQQRYPGDFSLSEFIEFVRPVQIVRNHVVAILFTQPVIKRSFPLGLGLFPVLPQPHLRRFCRESDVAITRLRPEPDTIDQAPGRSSGHHEMPSAAKNHNMQLTQFSTSVPCSAICRSRM